MTYPTSVIALFCEDAREETSGQHSLVGILADNGTVGDPPPGTDVAGIIPKLAIYLRMNFDVTAELGPVTFKLITPDGKEIPLGGASEATVAEARATREKGNPMGSIVSVFKMQNLPIPTLGRICMVVTIGSQTYMAGFLNITTGPEQVRRPTPLAL